MPERIDSVWSSASDFAGDRSPSDEAVFPCGTGHAVGVHPYAHGDKPDVAASRAGRNEWRVSL